MDANDVGTSSILYGDEEYQDHYTGIKPIRGYDKNGNTTYDVNSNIWGIHYNILNLPDTIQFSSGSQSIYTYAADGTKQKIVYKTSPEDMNLPVTSLDQVLQTVSNAKITSTDYCGNYIYENDTLKMILTPEGYIQNGVYYYYLKDHLGSNRVVLRQDGAIVERDNYYPSGARFGESVVNGGSVQPYRHTGMEMQGMHGLNWIDNEARMRTVNVPEFTTMDPLCELYCSISPYAYCQEDPINKTDPDGRGVNDNNLLPEVTITAATPESDESNYIQYDLYQQLLGSARTNINQLHKPRLMNLSSNININNVISSMPILKDNKASNNTLETISTAISAIGISSDNVKIAVREFGGEQIVYVTLKGTDAAVSVVKVASALKAIGVSAFFLGVIADVGLSATGQQSWAKTLVDTGISAAAITIGGVPGVIIGAGYMFLDKLGAFDRPDIQCNYNPGVCPQDVTKTVISNYTH
jgi:RHS repeat-associated protein